MRADQLQLSDEAKAAIKAFRDAKPWRGTFEERHEKFHDFAKAFADACGFTVEFRFAGDEHRDLRRPGNGGYIEPLNKIVLSGKLSVVTLLFSFGKVAGLSRSEALKWAQGLFKHYFPRSAANCRIVGGIMYKRPEPESDCEEFSTEDN